MHIISALFVHTPSHYVAIYPRKISFLCIIILMHGNGQQHYVYQTGFVKSDAYVAINQNDLAYIATFHAIHL